MHWQIGEYSNLWGIFEVLKTGRKRKKKRASSDPGQGLIDARWNKATNCPLRRVALNPCTMWFNEAYSIGIPGEVSATRISNTDTSTLIWKIGIKLNYKILWSKIFHEQHINLYLLILMWDGEMVSKALFRICSKNIQNTKGII